jgi:hypothetical protein
MHTIGDNLDDFVEKEDDFNGVGVSFRECEEVEIAMSYVQVLFLEMVRARSHTLTRS